MNLAAYIVATSPALLEEVRSIAREYWHAGIDPAPARALCEYLASAELIEDANRLVESKACEPRYTFEPAPATKTPKARRANCARMRRSTA